MSRASDIAAELKAKQDAVTARAEMLKDNRSAIASQADQLWEMVVSYINAGVKELVEAVELARNSGLAATLTGKTVLTIATRQLPLLTLRLNYQPGVSITGVLNEKFTALGTLKTSAIAPIRFTVDSFCQVCFTDGERFLCPEQVGDEILDLVGQFFEKALDHPAILS